jgi:hypothetical protein
VTNHGQQLVTAFRFEQIFSRTRIWTVPHFHFSEHAISRWSHACSEKPASTFQSMLFLGGRMLVLKKPVSTFSEHA